MGEDRRCCHCPVFVVKVVVIVVPRCSPASPGQGRRLEEKADGPDDVPRPRYLPPSPLEAGCVLRGKNGGSGGGGGGFINRVDESSLYVRPGQYIAGRSPLDLASAEDFARETIDRVTGADRSMGRIGGGGQGCCRRSNGDSNSNGGNNHDERGIGGSSCDGVGGKDTPSVSTHLCVRQGQRKRK